jgi:hypothetical protein
MILWSKTATRPLYLKPVAGVTRPIIDNCDNVPHVGDTHRWRPLSKKAAVTADMIWRLLLTHTRHGAPIVVSTSNLHVLREPMKRREPGDRPHLIPAPSLDLTHPVTASCSMAPPALARRTGRFQEADRSLTAFHL